MLVDDPLGQLKKRLRERHERAGSWAKCGRGSGFDGEYLRQIAKGEKDPPERTVVSLLRWLDQQPQLANVQPPTPEERERLARLLERVASFVREGYLPEAAWSDDRVTGEAEHRPVTSAGDGGEGQRDGESSTSGE